MQTVIADAALRQAVIRAHDAREPRQVPDSPTGRTASERTRYATGGAVHGDGERARMRERMRSQEMQCRA
jgi:hypothetical protein